MRKGEEETGTEKKGEERRGGRERMRKGEEESGREQNGDEGRRREQKGAEARGRRNGQTFYACWCHSPPAVDTGDSSCALKYIACLAGVSDPRCCGQSVTVHDIRYQSTTLYRQHV